MKSLCPSCSFLFSTIGKKIIVALTGIILLIFLLGHMIGNLLIYTGPEAINAYGHLLQTSLHGAGVWIARLVLLAAITLHIIFTILLTLENKAARGNEAYQKQKYTKARLSSRSMIWTGIIILTFIVYHIWHFTISPKKTDPQYYEQVTEATQLHHGKPRHDVYRMIINGFSSPGISAFYIFAMALLCSHLAHGFSSVFQTLGLRSKKTWGIIRLSGYLYAIVIFIGNSSIPISVLTGIVK